MFDIGSPIDGGYHIKVRDDGQYCVDILKMLYSYRIVLSPTVVEHTFIEHGWCYFGHGTNTLGEPRTMHTALLRVTAAAAVWDGYGEPPGHDKQAC